MLNGYIIPDELKDVRAQLAYVRALKRGISYDDAKKIANLVQKTVQEINDSQISSHRNHYS